MQQIVTTRAARGLAAYAMHQAATGTHIRLIGRTAVRLSLIVPSSRKGNFFPGDLRERVPDRRFRIAA
jgi:hypothetical protein